MNNQIKKRYVVGLGILICAGALFANIGPWYDNSKTPGILLPDAYKLALGALGSLSNQFHCVDAKIDTRFSPDGEWYFTFCSTNAKARPEWVTIEFTGKTHVENFVPSR